MKPNTNAKTVCVIDDDDAVRDSLQALLEVSGSNVTTFPDARSFLETYKPEDINCALIDVRMPGIDGIELLELLAERSNLPPVVIITGHGEVEMAVRAMKIGAFDFIEKPFEPDALIERVNAAIHWGESIAARTQKVSEARAQLAPLTPREIDVLKCLLAGLSNKAIATKIGLSPRTVEVHRAHIMEKTEIESLSHLVRLCLLAGLEPDDQPSQ
ncbi:MAG: response regulator [bacterium]|nr:response regulator [bacterium]